jgi:hypothetical protein
MVMVCPRCHTTQEQRQYCPVCSVRLQHTDRMTEIGRLDSWLQRPWGRIVLGLMLAQGLYHGLRQLAVGAWMATHAGSDEMVDPLIFQVVQGIGLLVGAVLAGAGQRTGALLGAVVGLINGILCLVIAPIPFPGPALLLPGLPVLQLVGGGIFGWLGRIIWQPLPAPTLPGMSRLLKPLPGTPLRPLKLFAGRIAWFRVLIGSAVSVAGWLLAVRLFHAVIDYSNGRLVSSTYDQDLLITWEIKVLAVLLGGALSGVNTLNGFKQGFCVAILTSCILLVMPAHHVDLLIVLLTMISIFTLCVAGGWFGSQLLPPVVKYRGRRGLGPLHG